MKNLTTSLTVTIILLKHVELTVTFTKKYILTFNILLWKCYSDVSIKIINFCCNREFWHSLLVAFVKTSSTKNNEKFINRF